MRASAYAALSLAALIVGAAISFIVQPGGAPTQAASVVASTHYDYAAPPSISRETYSDIWCAVSSAACTEAGQMYDVLVQAGLDPAVEAAQASHETTLGTRGVGAPAYKNAHGVQCFATDGRIGETSVPWGNGCAGVYANYTDAVRTWAGVIIREYVNEGLTTPALAVPKYAPTSDGNSPPEYIADMEAKIDAWRARDQYLAPASNQEPSGSFDPRRQQVIALALAQLGKPYSLGSDGPDQFDCSGLVHFVYGQVGVETTRTTFTQLDALSPIDPSQLQPGDLIYQQFPIDQHVVIFAGDLDDDGKADAIEAGGYLDGPNNVNILYNFFEAHPTFTNAIIGYRRAL